MDAQDKIGDKSYFSAIYTESVSGMVTFGDGRKSNILGKGKIMATGTPSLENVLLIENLQANLSVSQLCDGVGEVSFTKTQCIISNKEGASVMVGKRSNDNCYCFSINEVSQVCFRTSTDHLDLWHRQLGHMNYQDLIKLSKKECVRGLPNLSGHTQRILRLKYGKARNQMSII